MRASSRRAVRALILALVLGGPWSCAQQLVETPPPQSQRPPPAVQPPDPQETEKRKTPRPPGVLEEIKVPPPQSMAVPPPPESPSAEARPAGAEEAEQPGVIRRI